MEDLVLSVGVAGMICTLIAWILFIKGRMHYSAFVTVASVVMLKISRWMSQSVSKDQLSGSKPSDLLIVYSVIHGLAEAGALLLLIIFVLMFYKSRMTGNGASLQVI